MLRGLLCVACVAVPVAVALVVPCTPADHAADAQFRAEEIGRSVEGRSILAYIAGEGPTVMIIGGIHGDEPSSKYVVERLIGVLRHRMNLLAEGRVVLIPAVNPDGLARGTRRNANGVDINRNWPTEDWERGEKDPKSRYYRGAAPLSEPETRALHELLARYPPVRVLSVHAPMRAVEHGPSSRQLAEAMVRHNGYPLVGDLGHPTPGSLGTYLSGALRIPVVCLELSAPDSRSPEREYRENAAAVIEFIAYPVPQASPAEEEGLTGAAQAVELQVRAGVTH